VYFRVIKIWWMVTICMFFYIFFIVHITLFHSFIEGHHLINLLITLWFWSMINKSLQWFIIFSFLNFINQNFIIFNEILIFIFGMKFRWNHIYFSFVIIIILIWIALVAIKFRRILYDLINIGRKYIFFYFGGYWELFWYFFILIIFSLFFFFLLNFYINLIILLLVKWNKWIILLLFYTWIIFSNILINILFFLFLWSLLLFYLFLLC